MKAKVVIYIILALTLQISYSQEIDSLFGKANEAYASSDYIRASELYEKIVEQGVESAEVYFNLGNSHYKQNNLPQAILFYEKAKMISPNDEAINFNLRLVNTFKIDQIDEIPEFYIKGFITKVTYIMGYEKWGIFSILFFSMLSCGILIFLFTKKTGLKKISTILSILFFSLSIVSFALAHKRYSLQHSKNMAIIFSPTISVKSSPDMSGTDLFVLHEGTKVSIEDEVNNWLEIRIADGNKGWVKKEDIEII